MTKQIKKSGFSLVEMLIYIGLLAAIFTATVIMLVNLTSTYRVLKVSKDIDLSAATVMQRISSEIKAADSVNVAQSNLGTTTAPALALDTYTGGGASTIVKFFVSNNLLRVSEGGTDLGPLTASTTRVSRLIFYSITASSSDAVRVELTLQSGTSTTLKTEKFYTTAVLRGSYKNK